MSTVRGLECSDQNGVMSSQVGILLRGEQPTKGDVIVKDLDSVTVTADKILIEPSVQDSVVMRTPHCLTMFRDRQTMSDVIDRLTAARDAMFPRMPIDIEQEFDCFLAEQGDPVSQGEAEKFLAKLVLLNPKQAAAMIAGYLRDQ